MITTISSATSILSYRYNKIKEKKKEKGKRLLLVMRTQYLFP